MSAEGTKEAGEAVLRELPSVIGAFIQEDIHGNPREVHLLVRPGPSPRNLAYDIRDLLEERLGVPIDQRIISIAQLAPGRATGPLLAARAGDPSLAAGAAPVTPKPATPPAPAAAPAPAPAREPEPPPHRVRFLGLTTEAFDNRVRIRVALGLDDDEFTGEATGLDTLSARLQTVAGATLRAVDAVCVGRARFEVEHVATIRAFERDYVMVNVLASSPFLGRRPVPLVGAQPVELDAESAVPLATLKAVNRTLALLLRLGGDEPHGRRRASRT